MIPVPLEVMSNERVDFDMTSDVPLIGANQKAIENFVDDVRSLWLQQHHASNTIPTLEYPPTNMEFLRNHVATNRPCIIRNVNMIHTSNGSSSDHASSRSRLLDTLLQHDPNLLLTVDVTPDGYGDCLRQVEIPVMEEVKNESQTETKSSCKKFEIQECFVQPLQRRMTIRQFQQRLRYQLQTRRQQQPTNKDEIMNRVFESIVSENETTLETDTSIDEYIEDISNDDADLINNLHDNFGIVYYSRQNDCLRNGELSSTIWDTLNVPPTIDFTNQVFCNIHCEHDDEHHDGTGSQPAAMNLWIGNECTTSYLHKDYYENLYYVLSGGEKVVTLCPPSDIMFAEEKEYISGRFVQDAMTKQWKVRIDDKHQKVRWIGGDVTRKDSMEQRRKYPLMQYTSPITVRVKANEMIYIPSLWLHHITQISSSSFLNDDEAVATIAVNYWYEMNFSSPLYVYFHLLQQMKKCSAIDQDSTEEKIKK